MRLSERGLALLTQLEGCEPDPEDIAKAEAQVTCPATQCQFDALVCLAFETSLAGSTVLKRHKLGNYLGAARAFVDSARFGRVRRREAMARLYRGELA